MPLLEFIYVWSRISAVVAIGVMGLKGLWAPKAAIVEVPVRTGFAWEKSWWMDDPGPDMPDPIQVRINKCDLVGEHAPAVGARFLCKVQKAKLKAIQQVVRIMRTAYSLADTILPTFGGGGYVMLAELLLISFVIFTVKTQNSCLKMLMEKVCAVCKAVKTNAGQAPTEDTGMGQKDDVEELKSMDLGFEPDGLGMLGGEDLTFAGSSGGRRFHGELAFQEGINEEVGAGSEMRGSEVDGKTKKEVRFSDDSFQDHGISDAYVSKTAASKVPQRRVSPVKRMVSEPISKICGAKMTRSVPAAGAGAGSRSSSSSWHS